MVTYYIEKEFNLGDFEAWSGGADRLKEIIELDIVEVVQEYMEEMFEDGRLLTETDINDFLWFEINIFIEDYLTERAEEILDGMLSEALKYGTLYEIINDDNERELLIDIDASVDDWYGYYDLDEDTAYIENNALHLVDNEDTTVSSYMVDLSTGRVIFDDIERI